MSVTAETVNVQYEYTNDCCDPDTGASTPGSYVPHPIYTNSDGTINYIQMNAVVIGGVNGLNN